MFLLMANLSLLHWRSMSTPPEEVARWPEHLPVGAVRISRVSAHYEQTVQFYRDLVGLPMLESFVRI